MTTESKKVSNLAITTTLSANDRVVVLANTAGTAAVKTTTVANLIKISNTAPANTSAAGSAGSLAYDGTHLYVCVAANTWLRTNLSSW